MSCVSICSYSITQQMQHGKQIFKLNFSERTNMSKAMTDAAESINIFLLPITHAHGLTLFSRGWQNSQSPSPEAAHTKQNCTLHESNKPLGEHHSQNIIFQPHTWSFYATTYNRLSPKTQSPSSVWSINQVCSFLVAENIQTSRIHGSWPYELLMNQRYVSYLGYVRNHPEWGTDINYVYQQWCFLMKEGNSQHVYGQG